MERPRAKPDSTQDKLRKVKSDKYRPASKKREKIKEKRSKEERGKRTKTLPDDVSPRQDRTSIAALQPIEFYLSDGAAAVREMFHSLSEQQLTDLIPPGLKGVPLDDLFRLCTVELETMPRELLIDILHGREMPLSPQPQLIELGTPGGTNVIIHGETARLEAGSFEAHSADSTSGVTVESRRFLIDRLATSNAVSNQGGAVCGSIARPPSLSTEPSATGAEQRSIASAAPPTSFVCQSQLEIIELEARARAIKAMLSKVAPNAGAAPLFRPPTGSRKSSSSESSIEDDRIEDKEEEEEEEEY